MELPDEVLIRPLVAPVHTSFDFRNYCPGSKSLTNRSLILAALAPQKTELRGALWSEDTQLMVDCLGKLGFEIDVKPDSSNECNRRIIVHGKGGVIPKKEVDLFVGTAGTVARFLTAFCAVGKGRYRIHGTPRMHERPMKEIFTAIRSMGGTVEDHNGYLPATISGPLNPKSNRIFISETDSSQFASALWLISKVIGIEVESDSSPYVEMTKALIKEWEKPADIRSIELDLSNASYFLALHHLHADGEQSATDFIKKGWPKKSSQIDHQLVEHWPLHKVISRKKDLGDAVLTYVIMAAALKHPLQLIEAGNLRKQECDRIKAMVMELKKCNVPVEESSDGEGLILQPATYFHPATIHTYMDHRIAMCFTVLASMDVMGHAKPWIIIENPSCVHKTFPNFFKALEELAYHSYQEAKKEYSPMVLTTQGKPIYPF